MDVPYPNISDWTIIHHTFLGNSVLIVEGLLNMEEIKDSEFTFIALPLKIRGRDGSPVRAIAMMDE